MMDSSKQSLLNSQKDMSEQVYEKNQESDPPLHKTYRTLFEKQQMENHDVIVEEHELPLIDLHILKAGRQEREKCIRNMAKASSEWGFFQVVNHGISTDLLKRMSNEQAKVFRQPFEKKAKEKLLDFSLETYRWGAPSATNLQQLSWSEAFHIPLAKCSDSSYSDNTLRRTINEYAAAVSDLAQQLAQLLTENLGFRTSYFAQNCGPSSCYLRLNRYPPCPVSSEVCGLISHTDSDFLTILHQDQVGGLQLKKDGKWITVKPNQKALIVNIGDLFQAWSNDAYKSVEHRVMTNRKVERFSVAFFLCPSYDTIIETCRRPAIYRKFTFEEFRQQVQEDVRSMGHKIGLPRFLV
ncbi:gibberellin 2-beta-dioxygenase 8-like [Nymphaea colorata]|nr:gibberellin 2-beta-dioxygenase 8-like [Nymphaea colorata]XP_031499688.1 gibberellin 2-beta-dioxygenase 8-like [Nymphaea colorata]XP_031499689.1 gibberellin 2-beta-dioxygenase 8-like [Nymphaea colorata]